ncbi:MAG: IclR family transcriptional regulator [Terrimesophilobacter sp.]
MTAVPAARSTLRIIRYLAGHSGPVRAATMSRDLALPRSSIYHLLRVLLDEGFIVHSPEHQGYALAPLLGEIGSSVLASHALARLAVPVLERLVAETRLPVVAHLGVLQHADVVYASKVAAARAPAVVTSIGVRLPAHLTATGRAMLAALPRAQFEAIYSGRHDDVSGPVTGAGRHDGALPLRTSHGPGSVSALEQLLAETRDRGWAREDGDIDLAYASVAAAVLDHNDYPAAAVGLTFRRTLVDDAQWVRFGRAVDAAARALSRRIRGRG